MGKPGPTSPAPAARRRSESGSAPSPPGPRAGDHVSAEITSLDAHGAGIAALPGIDLHVAGALPGDRVSAVIEHVSAHAPGGRRAAWARLQRIDRPSPDRTPPACPAFGRCGGCVLQHLAYPAQLAWKRERVAAALAAHPALASIPIHPTVASPRTLGYRNQAKYACGRDSSGRLVLGAYAPRSHDIVDLAGCRVVEPVLDATASVLYEILEQTGVAPFDEWRRTGLLRHVVLRSSARGEVLATLVVAAPGRPEVAAAALALRARCPAVIGVVENLNAAAGNVIFGGEDRPLAGAPTIEDTMGDATVRLGPRSFFQANRDVAGLIYDHVRRAAAALGPIGRAIDAYAGAGGIALTLEPLGGEVVAIEENPAATDSIPPTRTGRIRFVTGDVADHLGAQGPADVVVLNPPRAGCARAALEAAARLAPRLLVYVSCNPDTLARDLAALARLGLECASVTPYDMLPHTPHVEIVALLRGRGGGDRTAAPAPPDE